MPSSGEGFGGNPTRRHSKSAAKTACNFLKMNHEVKFLAPHPGYIPQTDGVNWKQEGALKVRLPDLHVVVIPSGFKTDLASVPPLGFVGGLVMLLGWFLQCFTKWADPIVGIGFLVCIASIYIKPFGKYTFSAVFHDWMWRTQAFSFVVSNWYFLQAMKAEKTARWIRFLMWFNVMLFGWWIYRRYQKHFAQAKHLAHVTPHQHGHGNEPYGGHHWRARHD